MSTVTGPTEVNVMGISLFLKTQEPLTTVHREPAGAAVATMECMGERDGEQLYRSSIDPTLNTFQNHLEMIARHCIARAK